MVHLGSRLKDSINYPTISDAISQRKNGRNPAYLERKTEILLVRHVQAMDTRYYAVGRNLQDTKGAAVQNWTGWMVTALSQDSRPL